MSAKERLADQALMEQRYRVRRIRKAYAWRARRRRVRVYLRKLVNRLPRAGRWFG